MTKSDWQDFEIRLFEPYRKNPTVENAENIMQHFSDQVKNNPDEISPELQAWVNEKLVEGLGKKQKDNPIGKALGLVRKKGEQPSKEPEHAIAHMKIWEELFKGETLRNACLTVADEVSLSPEALQSSFRFTKKLLIKDALGTEIPMYFEYLEFEEDKFNIGLDTLTVKRGKSLTKDEISILNKHSKKVNNEIDKHNEREHLIEKKYNMYYKVLSDYWCAFSVDQRAKYKNNPNNLPLWSGKDYRKEFNRLKLTKDIEDKASQLLKELKVKGENNEL